MQQQRDLVEVSRQQVESEREALAYEHRVREETSLPRLTPSAAGGSFRGDGESTYSFSITNYGHAATGVMADLSLPDQALHRVVDLPLLETGASQRVSFNIQGPLQGADARLWLRCTDGLGRPQSVLYSVERVDDSPHAVLLVT
ncbi:hypothetical protein [Acaryochloris sp. IP29b_bin.148]|uniref:hypothetical protein n=1 Tax=Acaryochloris sp. IP29b_bin.148 TaxID=2969218 RepID=UPI0026069E75|nr:hypothetical protein [Acaryochloris sp. IP29b_bin.148]